MKMKLFCKNNYIADSYANLFDLAGEDDLEPVSFDANVFSLFARHNLKYPAIFKDLNTNTQLDFGKLEEEAMNVLRNCDDSRLIVYVTGMTPAVIAVINVCKDLKKDVTFMHYDKVLGAYIPQFVY